MHFALEVYIAVLVTYLAACSLRSGFRNDNVQVATKEVSVEEKKRKQYPHLRGLSLSDLKGHLKTAREQQADDEYLDAIEQEIARHDEL